MHRPGLAVLWLNRQHRGVLVIATKAETSVTPEVNAIISGNYNKIMALCMLYAVTLATARMHL